MQSNNSTPTLAQAMQPANQQPLSMPGQQQDPLAQLRDIHVPSEVNLWPLDWGWWVLIAFSVLALIGIYKVASAHIRHNKARKQALALLDTVSVQQDNWPVTLNSVLKRTAMSYYPKQQVAGLYGKQWQTFLTSALRKDNKTLEDNLALLVSSVYQAKPNAGDFEACKSAVREWLKKARFPKTLANHYGEFKHTKDSDDSLASNNVLRNKALSEDNNKEPQHA